MKKSIKVLRKCAEFSNFLADDFENNIFITKKIELFISGTEYLLRGMKKDLENIYKMESINN